MKKRIVFLVVSCLVLAASCHRNVKDDPNAFDFKTITVEDSVQFPEEAMEEWMFDDMAYYLGVVDVPITGNETLRDNIIGWMSDFMSSNYDGDSQDVQAMLNFDKDEFLGLESGTPQSSNQLFLTLQEDNDRYVTYLCDNYVYTGGAHGASYQAGATFSKKNGARFDFGMFKDPMELVELLKKEVKEQHFDPVNEETEFVFEEAIFPEAVEDFPLPSTDPWIQHDSVVFLYQSYEIAPYACGMPQCKLPYVALKEYLTDEGIQFFETPKNP